MQQLTRQQRDAILAHNSTQPAEYLHDARSVTVINAENYHNYPAQKQSQRRYYADDDAAIYVEDYDPTASKTTDATADVWLWAFIAAIAVVLFSVFVSAFATFAEAVQQNPLGFVAFAALIAVAGYLFKTAQKG